MALRRGGGAALRRLGVTTACCGAWTRCNGEGTGPRLPKGRREEGQGRNVCLARTGHALPGGGGGECKAGREEGSRRRGTVWTGRAAATTPRRSSRPARSDDCAPPKDGRQPFSAVGGGLRAMPPSVAWQGTAAPRWSFAPPTTHHTPPLRAPPTARHAPRAVHRAGRRAGGGRAGPAGAPLTRRRREADVGRRAPGGVRRARAEGELCPRSCLHTVVTAEAGGGGGGRPRCGSLHDWGDAGGEVPLRTPGGGGLVPLCCGALAPVWPSPLPTSLTGQTCWDRCTQLRRDGAHTPSGRSVPIGGTHNPPSPPVSTERAWAQRPPLPLQRQSRGTMCKPLSARPTLCLPSSRTPHFPPVFVLSAPLLPACPPRAPLRLLLLA